MWGRVFFFSEESLPTKSRKGDKPDIEGGSFSTPQLGDGGGSHTFHDYESKHKPGTKTGLTPGSHTDLESLWRARVKGEVSFLSEASQDISESGCHPLVFFGGNTEALSFWHSLYLHPENGVLTT